MLMVEPIETQLSPFVDEAKEEVADGRIWHVLCTGPQGELRGFRWLTYSGFSAYCPVMRRSVAQAFNRRRFISQPIFRGYLFVRLDPSSGLWDQIDRAPVSLRWLRLGSDRPVRLREEAIKAIRYKERDMDLATRKKKPGPAIELKRGDIVDVRMDPQDPYITYRAIVDNIDKLDDRGRISVLMEIFRRLTPMEVSVDRVRLA